MGEVTTIGLDLAKHVFQVHGVDAEGATVLRKQLRRAQVLAFFSRVSPSTKPSGSRGWRVPTIDRFPLADLGRITSIADLLASARRRLQRARAAGIPGPTLGCGQHGDRRDCRAEHHDLQ